ncbi:nonsense-mediated mRNA decay factor SMG8 isoform X1 [Hydra vulgaris]|nr:nonsense-mediated mRNA decay factor SMG8 [Hydra vulgaris]
MAVLLDISSFQTKLEEIKKSSNGNQKICVVGIIGRCHLNDKDTGLNQLVDHNVFKTQKDFSQKQDSSQNEDTAKVQVQMFYDEDQKTVFLQLNTVYDFSQLLNVCHAVSPEISQEGRHHYWQNQILKDAAAILFIFSVSHIVVILFPTPRFDLFYIRLFKMLASARYSMLHSLSQALAVVETIPEIWRSTGRPCIPRIIFSFQIPWKNAKGLNEVSIRKMQHSLQEQVHLILKKNRLLGNLSSSSLFTVSSPNQLFVHVHPQQKCPSPSYFYLNEMLKNSINMESIRSVYFGNKQHSSIISQPSPLKHDSSDNKDSLSLRNFLFKQIDYMMTVESREIPVEGRRGTHVEAPNISLWYEVCSVVFEFFLKKNDHNSHLNTLAQALDLDWKFSENRCCKVLPLATNAYLDNLPSHYTQSVHLNQLNACMHVFAMNARGPAYERYATQLQEDCNQVWWNGRHLCEGTSMTGQPCVYPYHTLPNSKNENSEEKTGVPVKSHSSRVTSVSACNCGRTQGTREDPFDIKSANFTFYQDLEKKCCSYLIHLNFPYFPIDEYTSTKIVSSPAVLVSNSLETQKIKILGRNHSVDCISSQPPNILSEVNTTQETSTQHSTSVEQFSERDRTISGSKDFAQSNLSFSGFMSTDHKDNSYQTEYDARTQSFCSPRQSATTSNLLTTPIHMPNVPFDGMLTTTTAPHLLPEFPSWSLIVLGSASLYNPLKGVDQVGFFSGSNYLLLWDIPVKPNDLTVTHVNEEPVTDVTSQEEQWPAPGQLVKSTPSLTSNQTTVSQSSGGTPIYQTVSLVQSQVNELSSADKPLIGKIRKPNSKETVSLKAYIGNEYECPRGHRFFCSAPDKMVKVSSNGHVRENAIKLVTANMPLYFPCPCRSSKPLHLAQIARTYVVTPDASITITLNPRVQPGERDVTPIFNTGIREGITLPPNSYCVLRFPYVYIDENGPILPPAPTQPLLTCRLLRGMFNYSIGNCSEDLLNN